MRPDVTAKYRRRLLLMGLGLLLSFFLSLPLGRYTTPLPQLLKLLLSPLFPVEKSWAQELEIALFQIRLPRICLAILMGGGLAVAGCAYQGVFQNPLAAPDLLGASNGAALGAAFAIIMGWRAELVTLLAFVCGLAVVGLALLLARRGSGNRLMNLILTGIILGSLCTAGISYLKLNADPANQLPQITYWLMGSLSGVTGGDLLFVLCVTMPGLVPLLLLRWRLNLLTLGDSEAAALGGNVELLRTVMILSATLVTAATVAVSGIIGWVGLVIPHFCRRLVGDNYRWLLPACLLCGGSFLLLVDDLARNLLATELPIGILTAVIGAPVFLLLLLRREEAK